MAKQSTTRATGGPSRIRFIMVEADLYDGDLAQVTQVLQNAFKTSPAITVRSQPARLQSSASAPVDVNDEVVDDEEEAGADLSESSPSAARVRKASPAKVPTVLNDIDTLSASSLKDFVSEYDIKTGFEKYLVIALWFRDARSINSITVDHVYTCFKLLGWSTKSTDFSKPLRNLRDQQSLVGDTKGYSLTLVGAGKIEEKKRAG